MTRPVDHARRLSKPRGASGGLVRSGGVWDLTGRVGSGRVKRFLNIAGRDELPRLGLTREEPLYFFDLQRATGAETQLPDNRIGFDTYCATRDAPIFCRRILLA